MPRRAPVRRRVTSSGSRTATPRVPAGVAVPPLLSPSTWVPPYSTVTLFARFRGLSTSVPRAQAV